MRSRWAIGLAALILAAACTGGTPDVDLDVAPSPEPDVSLSPDDALQTAAAKYATAVTSGDSAGAWAYLTTECRNQSDRDKFDRRVDWLRRKIGGGVVEGVAAAINGGRGTTTTTYSAGDGVILPGSTWVLEDGAWRTDVCLPPKP